MPREQKEVIGNRVDHPISDVHATALLSNVSPNAVEIRFDLYRSGPPSAEPCLLGIKAVLVPAFLLRWPDSAHPARSQSRGLPLAPTQFPQNQQHREFLPACARVLPIATEPLPRRPRRGQTGRTRYPDVQKLPGRVLIARPWLKGRGHKLQCQACLISPFTISLKFLPLCS